MYPLVLSIYRLRRPVESLRGVGRFWVREQYLGDDIIRPIDAIGSRTSPYLVCRRLLSYVRPTTPSCHLCLTCIIISKGRPCLLSPQQGHRSLREQRQLHITHQLPPHPRPGQHRHTPHSPYGHNNRRSRCCRRVREQVLLILSWLDRRASRFCALQWSL